VEPVNDYGYGSGSGPGYGYGYGYGSGYGYGYGDGDGYGSGSGSGYGYGYGYGYGDGDGSGSGDGLQTYLSCIATAPPNTRLAVWRANADGSPANGGGGQSRKVGDVETIPGPLKICTSNALHGTLAPRQWKGERAFIVALYEPVAVDGDKIASLKREILAEIPNYWEGL